MLDEKIFALIKAEAPLIGSPLHGLFHWRTVERNGLYLARSTGADETVVSYFAYFHDCRRESEGFDTGHGPRAAEFVREHASRLPLDEVRLKLLCLACEGHTTGRKTEDPTIGTCWDADRLDIGRAGIERDPKYFFSPEARRIVREKDDRVLDEFSRVEKG